MNRREFSSLIPALLAMGAASPAEAEATSRSAQVPKATQEGLKPIVSGTYQPGPGTGTMANRVSHRYVMGMLVAGNIRLEMHETIQEPGAEHEPVGTHLHSEIWLVQRGVASLFINGVEHRMGAGEVGIVNAGDKHWIKNVGDTELAYFVVTVGPPEPV